MKHTSGPWTVKRNKGSVSIDPMDGHGPICNFRARYSRLNNLGELDANARLIAAAPDLLGACEIALANLTPLYASDHLVIKSLRAAIRKTEGRY